jgi:hypothetical protein
MSKKSLPEEAAGGQTPMGYRLMRKIVLPLGFALAIYIKDEPEMCQCPAPDRAIRLNDEHGEIVYICWDCRLPMSKEKVRQVKLFLDCIVPEGGDEVETTIPTSGKISASGWPDRRSAMLQ